MQQLHQDQLIQVFLKGMLKAALLFYSAGVFSGGGGIEGEFPPKIWNSHPHLKKLKFLGGAFPPRSDLWIFDTIFSQILQWLYN